MLYKIQLPDLPTYHDFLAEIMCNPASHSCCLGECPVCPDVQLLKEEILTQLEKLDVDKIVFKQWVSTD